MKLGQASILPTLPTREARVELLEKVGKSLLGMPYKSWNFGDSTGFEGILETGRLLKDPTYFAFASGWIRAWASRPEPFKPLDCTAPGVAMVEIGHENKDQVIIESLNRLATYLMDRPKNRGIYETWETFCLIPPYGGDSVLEEVNIELGNSDDYQLYNLKVDISQKNNLAKSHAVLLKAMVKDFELIRGKEYKKVEKLELK